VDELPDWTVRACSTPRLTFPQLGIRVLFTLALSPRHTRDAVALWPDRLVSPLDRLTRPDGMTVRLQENFTAVSGGRRGALPLLPVPRKSPPKEGKKIVRSCGISCWRLHRLSNHRPNASDIGIILTEGLLLAIPRDHLRTYYARSSRPSHSSPKR